MSEGFVLLLCKQRSVRAGGGWSNTTPLLQEDSVVLGVSSRLMSAATSTFHRGDSDGAKNSAGVRPPEGAKQNAAKSLMKHKLLGSFQFAQNHMFNSLCGHRSSRHSGISMSPSDIETPTSYLRGGGC